MAVALCADGWLGVLRCLAWPEALALARAVPGDGLLVALARRLADAATGAELCRAARRLCGLHPSRWAAVARAGVVVGGVGLRALGGAGWGGPDATVVCPAAADGPGAAGHPLLRRVVAPAPGGQLWVATVDPGVALLAARAAGVEVHAVPQADGYDVQVPPHREAVVAGVRAAADPALRALVVVGRHPDERRDAALAALAWPAAVAGYGALRACRRLVRPGAGPPAGPEPGLSWP